MNSLGSAYILGRYKDFMGLGLVRIMFGKQTRSDIVPTYQGWLQASANLLSARRNQTYPEMHSTWKCTL